MKRCVECKSTEVRQAEVPITLALPFRTAEGELNERVFEGTVSGFHCDACGVDLYDGPDLERFERLVALCLLTIGISTGAEARFLRKKAGLRAAELAVMLGVTPETISHWETGRSQPGLADLAVVVQLARDEFARDESSRQLLSPAPHVRELLKQIRVPRQETRVHVGSASRLAA